jgi:hypothetical protein
MARRKLQTSNEPWEEEDPSLYWDYLNSIPEKYREKELAKVRQVAPDYYERLMSNQPRGLSMERTPPPVNTSKAGRLTATVMPLDDYITEDNGRSTDDALRAFFEKEDRLLRQMEKKGINRSSDDILEERRLNQLFKPSNVSQPLKEKLPKLNIEDFIIEENEDGVFLREKERGKIIGRFPYKDSYMYVPELTRHTRKTNVVPLEGYITMDYPKLDPEYQKRGLGEQAYKKVEELTGKKILPDSILSEYSSALHEKKGLGKSFGKQEYGPDIIKLVAEQLEKLNIKDPEAIERLSKEAFSNFKRLVTDKVPSFKSVAPILTKGALAAGTAGVSLATEAADQMLNTESLNDDANANRLLKIEEGAEKFKKSFPSEDEYYKFQDTIKNLPTEDRIPLETNNVFPRLKQRIRW